MKIDDLMGVVVKELHSGLTGGSAELPLPPRTIINWVQPGIPFHESFFDFAVAGPFAGPTPANLDDFAELVETLQGEPREDGAEPRSRDDAVEDAKRMYQQHLLGSWEQWSRLVDFIPLVNPSDDDMGWSSSDDEGEFGHKGVVYAQAGQRLSDVYRDTLERCLVAEEKLTEQQQKTIERMRRLLQVEVERENFLTGNMEKEIVESPAMTLYNEKKVRYENAVIDYATRLAKANSGSAQDLIEWNQSGGIYRERAMRARQDWQATGNKNLIEEAQSAIAHITGGNMVSWKQALLNGVKQIDDNTQGAFGYPFFPSTVIPGTFARSDGWTRYSERDLKRKVQSSSSSQSASASGFGSFGFFSIGGSGGWSKSRHDVSIESDDFGLEFDYTQVEIVRPAFNPNFFLSRGWKPRDTFVRDYGTDVHSDGADEPTGALIGYPTKALFVKDLKIWSRELAYEFKRRESTISGGGALGIGPFMIGGKYQQANKSTESNYEWEESGITIRGIQLVAFLSALFPTTSNPSPDVSTWV